MQIMQLNNIPIISLLNLYNINYNNTNFLISILGVTSFIEFTQGHLFILLMLFINTNLDLDYMNSIYFMIGIFLISILSIIKKISTKILVCIFLGIIYFSIDYINSKSNEPRKVELKKSYLIGVSLATLLFLWIEFEKQPKLKYVKLFYKK
jgi:predicted membrane protein